MKKTFILMCLLLAGSFVNAQTRIALYEEFTGENCGPCAATNPGLNNLLLAPANATNVIAIKWQVPIPSAPTTTWSLYQTDLAEIDSRSGPVSSGGYGYPQTDVSPAEVQIAYAPNGRMNGEELNVYGITGQGGQDFDHPGYLTAAAINSAQALATPFAITMTPAWDATYDNAVVSVTVQSSTTFTAAGALVYRLVLVERVIHFALAPGSNGEKDFYDPVRKSYPNIQNGTALSNTWTAGQIQTFTIACAIPSYIIEKPQMAFVGFIQDDGSKKIWQAARTASVGTLPNDVKTTAAAVIGFSCATAVTPTISVLNQGSNAITSMTITPSIDGVAQTAFNWTGNIAAGATSVIAVTGSYNSTQGSHLLKLDVTGVSGGDVNNGNNAASTNFILIQNYFPGVVTESYTTASFPPVHWFVLNADQGASWSRDANAGLNGNGSAKYDFFDNGIVGDADELYLPPADLSGSAPSPSLSFDVAYSQFPYTPTPSNDKLEVKVSTDCGATWASIYSKSGSILSTATASQDPFVPNSSQWRHESVALPAGASNNASVLVKFIATSDFGNNLYIDNVNLAQAPNGIRAISNNISNFEIYPNPTKGETNVSITTISASNAKISVVNTLGQVVFNKEIQLNFGVNNYQVDTKEFATGMYNVIVESNSGSVVKKLTVIK